MATEVGSAYVTLIPSAKGFGSAMQRELGGDIARQGTVGGEQYSSGFASKAGSGLKSKASTIFSSLKVAGIGAAVVAGTAITKTLVDSIGAASDLNETLGKAGQIFGQKSLPLLSKWAGDAATTMGQSKQQALDAASNFAIFGKSAGLSGKDLVGFSTKFTGLASDLASFHNTSPQDAIDALGAAMRGEAEPMRKYGVLLDDASMRQEALRQGLIKNTKTALTPQQKVLAAQGLIYKQTKDAQGDFARTSGGLANQQRILSARWDNMKTTIGQGLLPIVLKLVTAFNDLMPLIGKWADEISKAIGPAISIVVDFLSNFWDSLTGGGGNREQVTQTVSWLSEQFAVIVSIVKGVIGIIEFLWANFGSYILEFLSSVFAALVPFVKSTFENLKLIIGGALRVIKGVVDLVMALLHGDWSGAWDAIKEIVSGVWDIIRGIVRQAIAGVKLVLKLGMAEIKLLLQVAWTIVKGVLTRAWEGIKAAVRAGINALVRLVKALPGLLLAALRGLGNLLVGLLRSAWNAAKTAVNNAISDIFDAVSRLPGKLLELGGAMLNAGSTLIQKFISGLGQAGGAVASLAGSIWDAVRGLINNAIDTLNDYLSFTISLPGPDVHVDLPNIPHLASGARATAGTLAVIGEGREPETVLPDSMLRGLLERAHSSGRSQVAELTITNWHDGTGYLRLVARDEISGEGRFRRGLVGMHA